MDRKTRPLFLDDFGFRVDPFPCSPLLRENSIYKDNEVVRMVIEKKYEKKIEKTNKPDYNVCVGVKTQEKTFWQKIGAGWESEKGISIKLNALPLSADIVLFPNKDEENE